MVLPLQQRVQSRCSSAITALILISLAALGEEIRSRRQSAQEAKCHGRADSQLILSRRNLPRFAKRTKRMLHSSTGKWIGSLTMLWGGGGRITRVTRDLGDGKSRKLADIRDYAEDQFRELAQIDPVYGHIDLTESDQCFWPLLRTFRRLPSVPWASCLPANRRICIGAPREW